MKKGLAILLSFLMVLSLALPGSLTIHAEEMVNAENVKIESELPEYYDTDISMLTVDEGNSEETELDSGEEINTTEEASKKVAVEDEIEEKDTSAEEGVEERDSKFEDFLKMVEEMPSVEEIEQMDEEKLNDVVDKYYNLLDAYDELTEEDQEQFAEEYSDLYTFVFDDLEMALEKALNTGIEVMSLLPLEERRAYLVVGSHDGIDISAVPIDIVLENLRDSKGNIIDLPSNAKIVWSYYKDKNDNVISDNYFELKEGGTLDLSIFEEYDRYSMEMIVGDGNQLSPDNIRYIVTVYLTDSVGGLRTYEWYTQDADGTRHKVTPSDVNVTAISMGSDHTFVVSDHVEGREYYLGVNDPVDEHPFVQLDVVDYADFLGIMLYQAYGLGEYPYTNLADQMVNQNMKKANAGYKKTWDAPKVTSDSVEIGNMFGFIYKNSLTGEVLKQELVQFSIVGDAVRFDDKAFSDDADVKLDSEQLASLDEIKDNPFDITDDDLSYIKRVFLKEGYDADSTYYYALYAHSPIWDNANTHVVKAVKGSYHSLDEASGLEDISAQLLPKDSSQKGYLANYNIENGGQTFTVFFDDDSVFRFLVVFQNYDKDADVNYVREYSDVPIVGEADPWFRISGATDVNGNDLNTYVIENGKRNNIDTMYGYGYQAVFINDAVDKFIPKFWKVNDEAISLDNIYVNGKIYNEGDALSFESGSNELDAVFSVIITDKKGPHTKNYSVKFVKKANGPKLYVAGPLAPDVRSIFLDEHHENKHDIFIANVGDAPLTDLWLDLDATNVELDNYWTIGGEGNNTLAACPADFNKVLMESDYGEQPNVAKIRLIPPTSGKGGEISGTLKIYSGAEGNPENSELLATIILSDLAQNPEITTDALDDAVLYVPYSYLITTNNMYDWVDVSYEIVEGSLPNGVELIESTGEIYGVPLETGDFKVKIATHFNSTSANYAFTPSTVELTLTVLDNTNANVYNATDMAEGYQILDAIGTDEGGYDFVLYTIEDTIYRSNGEFGEFVDLWLNGEKLTRGVDYDAESGSTKITIYSETFDNKANQSGRNTIAAEFRTTDTSSKNNTDNTNQLNRTSQNFRISTTCTHSYNSGVITKAATCTVAGVRTYTCTKCGATKTESIAATGHAYDEGVVTKEPTYDVTGIKTYTCQSCGETMTEVIPVKERPNTPNPDNGNGNGTNNNGTDNGNGTTETVNTLTCSIRVLSADGMSLNGMTLELHSTPQSAILGEDGFAKFNPIEFGEHTIILKDKDGNVLAEKHITVNAGMSFAVNGDVVTAVRGSNCTLTVRYNGDGTMTLVSIQGTDSPQTGDNSHLNIYLVIMMLALIALGSMILVKRRKRC